MFKTLLLFTLTASALAAPKEYLFCLGQEEKLIHTQRLNPARKLLNEKIISLALQLTSSVSLNKNYLPIICKSKTPSLVMLKLMLNKSNLFKINVPELDKNPFYLAQGSIKEINEQSIYLFLEYLNHLKSLNKDPNCFKKYFPKLNKVLDDAVYTFEEVGSKALLKSMGDLDEIFKKLKTYPSGLKEC